MQIDTERFKQLVEHILEENHGKDLPLGLI